MVESRQSGRIVVIDEDDQRRADTCALLAAEGYFVIPLRRVSDAEGILSDDVPSVVVRDVSLPRSAAVVAESEAALRQLVDRRCPIVLYGNRPPVELSELDGLNRSSAHIPSDDGGRALLSLLRRVTSRASRPSPSASGEHIVRALPKLRLLLIDDSEMTLEIMQDKLAALDFDVRIAVALGEVRALIANWAPNIIVADVRRPDIPGDVLCSRLKATVPGEVMVVLCSSLPDHEIEPLAHAANADGWASKAHGLDGFAERIQMVAENLLGARSKGEVLSR